MKCFFIKNIKTNDIKCLLGLMADIKNLLSLIAMLCMLIVPGIAEGLIGTGAQQRARAADVNSVPEGFVSLQPEKIIDGRCDGECTEIAIKITLIEYECYDNNREALEAVEGANQPINDIQLSTANDAWSGAFDYDEDEILKDLYSTYMLCLCKLLRNEQILDEEKPQAVAELFERIMYCMAMALDSERGRRIWSGIIRGAAGGAAAFLGFGIGFIFALGGPITLLLGAVLGGITIASFNGLNGVEWKNELMRCLKANLCE